MKKYFKIILFFLTSIIIFIVIGATTVAGVKNIIKEIRISNFKNKCNKLSEDEISSIDNINKLSGKACFYRYKSDEGKKAFSINNRGEILPGDCGDILVSTDVSMAGPLIDGFVSFYAGGHAAFITGEYEDHDITLDGVNETIEASGMRSDDNPCIIGDLSYWNDEDKPFSEVIGLRVKCSDEERKIALSYASSILGDLYNYSFLFNTVDKSYCSDLISKAYNRVGYNLNKDGLATTIYDLIASQDCYIFYYHKYIDGIKHVYYME